MRHPEDVKQYEIFLLATADKDGVLNRIEAEEKLVDWLLTKEGRAREFAHARALQVAKGFDDTHTPQIDGQAMLPLDIDTFIVLGGSERINVDKAKSIHTLLYMDILTEVNTRANLAYGITWRTLRENRALQDAHNLTLLAADKLRRDQASGGGGNAP